MSSTRTAHQTRAIRTRGLCACAAFAACGLVLGSVLSLFDMRGDAAQFAKAKSSPKSSPKAAPLAAAAMVSVGDGSR